jgi:hypothetical protein
MYPPQTPAPAPQPPRRNSGVVALIASLAVLAVVAIAVVVVVLVRSGDEPPQTPGPASTTAAAAAPAPPSAAKTDTQVGPVDSCLIGNWRQTQYSALFDLSDVTSGGKALGQVKLSGKGRTWQIKVDGTAVEDFSGAAYTGKTTGGQTVTMAFTGSNRWTLKTANQEILFTSTGSTVAMTVSVDGKQALHEDVAPHNNPQPYECGKNSWSATSLTDPDAGTKYERTN